MQRDTEQPSVLAAKSQGNLFHYVVTNGIRMTDPLSFNKLRSLFRYRRAGDPFNKYVHTPPIKQERCQPETCFSWLENCFFVKSMRRMDLGMQRQCFPLDSFPINY